MRASRRRPSLTIGRARVFVLRTLLVTAAALAFTTGSAAAATLSFTGAFSSDWNTAGNWTNTANTSLHAVPTAADDARIPLGAAPVLATGANGAARSVVLDAGGSLSVSGHELSVAGGVPSTLQGAISLSGAATLRLGGATTWGGGDWTLDGSAVSNTGTLTITGDVTAARVNAASTLTNTGTITRNDATPATGAAVLTPRLVNGGTFAVANGTADLRGGGSHTGTLSVAAGALLATSGAHTLAGGGSMQGAGTLRLDGGNFSVPLTAVSFTAGTLLLSGGFLDLEKDSQVGRLTADGEGGGRNGGNALLGAGGPTLLDNVSFEAGATRLTGPSVTMRQLTMRAAVIQLADTAQTLWDTGNWDLSSARIENAGSLRITGDGTLVGLVSSTLESTGTITRDDASPGGIATIRAGLLNDGDVNVVSGDLQLAGNAADASGGTFNITAPGVLSVAASPRLDDKGEITGTGTLRLDAGALAVPSGTGVFDPATIVFSGGFLNLGRTATVGRLTSDGQGGGRTSGNGTLNAGGPTVLDNVLFFGGTTNLTGPAVTLRNVQANSSEVNLTGTAQAVWDSGNWELTEATITNAGELRITGDGTATSAADPALVRNTGTLIRDDAAPATGGEPFTATLRNSGLLHVVDGALDLGAVGEQTAGRTLVDPGATLGGAGGQYTVDGGRLEGTGTVAGALENAGGIVGPGASPGILTVDGAFTQNAGGTLETEVTGLAAGTGYDRLAVSGAVTLGGTLDIVTPAGFTPALGSAFDVVTGGSLTGTFAGLAGADLGDRQYVADYSADPARVRLSVSGADPTEGHAAVVAGSLDFTAAAGDVANSVTVTGPSGGKYSVRDTGAPVTAGSGCFQINANLVRCATAGITRTTLELGGGKDAAQVSANLSTTAAGGGGADRLVGGPADDALAGGADNDRLVGRDGADSLDGGLGTDLLDGGTGPDALNGQAGTDTVTYASRTAPVTVTIDGLADDGGADDGPAGDNVATDVENLVGGNGDDTLVGSGANNTLTGGAGADALSGSDGIDRVSYSGRTDPVTVTIDDLADDGSAADGSAGARDNVFTDVESLVGGSGADSLTGSDANNTFDGGAGADTFSGLGGVDVVTYGNRTAPVTVTIDGAANDGDAKDGPAAARDNVAVDVENLGGGSGADTLTGSAGPNRLTGLAGADILRGLDGNDVLVAKDGVADTELNCDGGATDLVYIDALDPPSIGCELIR